MRYVRGVLLVLTSMAASSICSAQEEEAVTVFDRVSPSIVGIESVASSGTGVLLDAKGTILTNAHVVALQLPLKCLIDVRKGAKFETNTYRKVTVIGIHPKLDLALLKIDPAENPGTLTPAAINHGAPKTGQRVYAIGNPGAKGQVKLTKTVTSGILSGVDRVIEEVSYLQFSAPINPGNSGGPLCDKAGKIIGLVTMKLPDLDNVGFAIPLQDIKAAEFKPFAERPKDTVKSGKMINAGNSYIDQLNKVRLRPGGSDSPQALILRILALDCMHEALLLDPTNGSIYMSIGDLADEFEEYEVAEEYFRAGISASPWHTDPRIYRTYGRHKLRLKKPDEAEVIWWEGIARHPHLAGLIWEDLAILYQAKGDYHQSAVCASAASMLKSPGSRPEVALRVGDQSFHKITDPVQRAQTLERVAGMAEEMFRRIWQRKLLLGQKRSHLTPAFGAYAQKIGLKLDGSLTAAASPFVVPAFDQRLTDIAATANPGQPGLGAAWKRQEATLISSGTAVCRLDGQATLPEEYDLMISAERLSGKDEVVIGFEHQQQGAAVILDYAGNKSGFAGLKGPLNREAVLPQGEFVSLLVQVRKKKVTVRVNEKEILTVALNERLPAVPEKWGGASASKLFIATQSSSLALHAWQLVKLPTPAAQPPMPVTGQKIGGSPTPSSPTIPTPSSGTAGSPPSAGGLPEIASLQDTSWGFKCLAMSPDGRFVAGGRSDAQVWIFDVEKNKKVAATERLDKLDQVTSIIFTPDGKHVLGGGYKGIVQVWDFQEGVLKPGKQFVGHSVEIKSLACSPDGKYVLSGDREGRLRYWDLESCREQHVWADFRQGANAVRFLPDGKSALATDGGNLFRLNLKSGAAEKTKLDPNSGYAHAAEFSRDGKYLAVSVGSEVLVWQTTDVTKQAAKLAKSRGVIWTVGFTPDGKQLLTGADKTLNIWDLQSGNQVNEAFVGPIGYVQTFGVSADGKRLTSIISMAGQPLKVFAMPAAR